MTTLTEKIKAVKIVLERAEGRAHECVKKTVEGKDVWSGSMAVLCGWAHTAPGKGGKSEGYHKCDFTITFADGQIYEGRYDLTHFDIELPNLQKHVQNFLDYTSGAKKPAHWTDKEQAAILARDPEMTATAKLWLEKYQIGD